VRWNSSMNKPCELISWARFQKLSQLLVDKITASGFDPDLIIAIGRGGYIPARLLSDYLDIMDITTFKIEHYRGSYKHSSAVVKYPLTDNVVIDGRRILVVDDVSDSGDTFTIANKHIAKRGSPKQIKTAVLHHKTTSIYTPDYYAQRVIKWRWIIYPWAVTEDVASFIESDALSHLSLEGIAEQLKLNHGIQVPLINIQNALRNMSGAHEPK
jgi:hypoxanthine phosphoribosyltransferase